MKPLVLVMYKFDGTAEHPVQVRPHDNSKSKRPYSRIMQSVRKNLAADLETRSPREAITKAMNKKGGLISARSAAELPLQPQQVYNIKHQLKAKQGCSSGASKGKGRDLLFTVMEQCKLSQKESRFVQEVTCAPEPMAILATDQQLLDMERFCTNESAFSVVGVDPTFNLGDFSVTPIVFQHLMLHHRKTGKSPWFSVPC